MIYNDVDDYLEHFMFYSLSITRCIKHKLKHCSWRGPLLTAHYHHYVLLQAHHYHTFVTLFVHCPATLMNNG